MMTLRRSRRLECSLADARRALSAFLERTQTGPVSVYALPRLRKEVRGAGASAGQLERVVRLVRRQGAATTGPQCILAWQIRDAHACSRFAGLLALDLDDGVPVFTLSGSCESAAALDSELEHDAVVRALSERTADDLLDLLGSGTDASCNAAA